MARRSSAEKVLEEDHEEGRKGQQEEGLPSEKLPHDPCPCALLLEYAFPKRASVGGRKAWRYEGDQDLPKRHASHSPRGPW